MAQELGLSDYTNTYELGPFNTTQKNSNRKTEQPVYSNEDIDQFSFNGSVIADFCQIDQSQQNSTQLCCCCNDLLRKLLKEYQNLKTERDFLLDKVSELSKTITIKGADFQDSGSGSGFLEY